nr:HipA family kinase [Usitatibacter rugosus]
MAAMLARDLGMGVPTPFAIRISEAFVSSIVEPEAAEDFMKAMPVTFGTELLVGMNAISTDTPFSDALIAQAGDAFAFDVALDNTDRRLENPNCLCDGKRMVLLDHELTFFFGTLFWQEPWNVGALETWKAGVPHLFYSRIRGKNLSFTRLSTALGGVTPQQCDAYVAALPDEWRADFYEEAQEMADYIKALVANAPAVITEVRRVLA